MWVLLLLGSALLPPPGSPAVPPRRGPSEPSPGGPWGVCALCRSPHRGGAQLNGTLGASVTLGCPAGGAPLGRLLAQHWLFRGDTAGAGVTICSQRSGPPSCDPRASLGGPDAAPGELLLRELREGDAGTYSCLLLGEQECACGSVTLRLGPPCSPPCSGTPPRGACSFSLGLLLLLLLLLV